MKQLDIAPLNFANELDTVGLGKLICRGQVTCTVALNNIFARNGFLILDSSKITGLNPDAGGQ